MPAARLMPFQAIAKYLRESYWEAINYTLGVVLFGFGVYSLTSSSFWIGYIGEMTQGLVEVGFVSSLEGKATRRTFQDSIWLSLTKNKKVYSYDTIATQNDTTLEINLDNIKITLEENSLVRIKNINGKPVIRVARGIVSANVGEGSELLVQTSMKRTAFQRGRYLLTSEDPPDAEENEADGDIANGLRAAKNIAKKAGAHDEHHTEEEELKERLVAPKADEEVIEWKLPTPAENMLFLVQRHSTILFGYRQTCDTSCNIVITQNGNVVKQFYFKPGEVAVIHVSTRDLSFGQFVWQFSGGGEKHLGNFEIAPYSQEKLYENLNLKRSFEILN